MSLSLRKSGMEEVMPKPTPTAFGKNFPAMSNREIASHIAQQLLRTAETPTIQVYGEAIIELGGKEYVVNAPGGVTIRERTDSE